MDRSVHPALARTASTFPDRPPQRTSRIPQNAFRFVQGPRTSAARISDPHTHQIQQGTRTQHKVCLTIYTIYFAFVLVQCEDLYELISCLLPEVTASPAQHCTYQIFGTNSRGFDPYFLLIKRVFLSYCLESAQEGVYRGLFLAHVVGEILCFFVSSIQDGDGCAFLPNPITDNAYTKARIHSISMGPTANGTYVSRKDACYAQHILHESFLAQLVCKALASGISLNV
jgi:hypothetical protein